MIDISEITENLLGIKKKIVDRCNELGEEIATVEDHLAELRREYEKLTNQDYYLGKTIEYLEEMSIDFDLTE